MKCKDNINLTQKQIKIPFFKKIISIVKKMSELV